MCSTPYRRTFFSAICFHAREAELVVGPGPETDRAASEGEIIARGIRIERQSDRSDLFPNSERSEFINSVVSFRFIIS